LRALAAGPGLDIHAAELSCVLNRDYRRIVIDG